MPSIICQNNICVAFLTNVRILTNCSKVWDQSGPCDPVSHFCLPQFIGSERNLSNSVNQVYDLSPLFYSITLVHHISVVMFNLKAKRESKNKSLGERQASHQWHGAQAKFKSPWKYDSSSCPVLLFHEQHTARAWFVCSWYSMEVMSSLKSGSEERQWADSRDLDFQVLILTFSPSMCYIFLECLLTTSWGNSFSFG